MFKIVKFDLEKEGHLWEVTHIYLWKVLLLKKNVLLNEYAVD